MTETLTPKRSLSVASLAALALFIAVYAATLVVLFAPKDMLSAQPASLLLPDE